jgi:hypothetical protein
MSRVTLVGCAFLIVAGVEATASAQATRAAGAPDSARPMILYETDPDGILGHHPFLLGRDLLVTESGPAVNVAPDHVGEPVRVPIAVTFAARENLALGLHSREGVCLTGSSHGCAHAWNQLGADVLYAPIQGYDSGLALRLGFSAASFTPMWPRLAVGAPIQASLARDRLLLRFEPGLEWGLDHTDGNAAVFVLPARLQVLPIAPLSFFVAGGLQATWHRAGERYVIPLVLGLVWTPAPGFDVRVEVTMAAKAGGGMPESSRRIFYDSAATLPLAVYDRSLLVSLRLYGNAFKWRRRIREPAEELEEAPSGTDDLRIRLLRD